MSRKIKIDYGSLEISFGLNSHEMDCYLDTETGDIILIEDYVTSHLEHLLLNDDIENISQAQTNLSDTESQQLLYYKEQIENDLDNRYLLIPKQDSYECYQDMEIFISSLEDEHLREVLAVAIQGSGAFRRFKDVLYRYHEAQHNWFKFSDKRQKQRIIEWLNINGIEPEFG